jgi:hypothetical protein
MLSQIRAYPGLIIIVLIKRKTGFSGKMFWTHEIPFKTGFTVYYLKKFSPERINHIKSLSEQ